MSGRSPSFSELRWLVLGEDGRHFWLGRARDPAEAEIREAEATLAARSEAGWLPISEGDYWATGTPMTMLAVRPLAGPTIALEQAARRFEAIRAERLSGIGR